MTGPRMSPDLDAIQAPTPVAFHKLNRAQLLTLAIALQDQRDDALALVRSQQAQIERVRELADQWRGQFADSPTPLGIAIQQCINSIENALEPALTATEGAA